jgi:hypothetical protein
MQKCGENYHGAHAEGTKKIIALTEEFAVRYALKIVPHPAYFQGGVFAVYTLLRIFNLVNVFHHRTIIANTSPI